MRQEEARRLEEERRRAELRRQAEKKAEAKKEVVKKEVIKVTKTDAGKRKVSTSSSSHSLLELHSLRLRLEAAEDMLSQHIHVCFGDNGVQDCSLKISQLEVKA